jgi:hypothetical protein
MSAVGHSYMFPGHIDRKGTINDIINVIIKRTITASMARLIANAIERG